jgi:putative methionine-R-sulfoxide reductase with GAF domain/nitrogen-specific signal transduction histidine kinase
VQLFEHDPASFDLAIIDYSLEGQRNGVELLRRLHQSEPHLPVIIITGVGDRKISQEALRAGAFWYLDKPHDLVELEMLLKWVGRYRATSQPVSPQSVWGANLWIPVSNAIVSAQTVLDMIEAVRGKARGLLEAEHCGILEVDPETGVISDWSNVEVQEQEYLTKALSPLARDITLLEKPHLSASAGTRVDGVRFQTWAACACPPTRGATEILFALFDKGLDDAQKLSLELKLIALARLIGVALENIRKAKFLEVLVDSGKALQKVRNRQQVYQTIERQILEKLGVRTFYLALHQRSTGTVHCPVFFYQGADIRDGKPVLDLKSIAPDESFTVYTLIKNKELLIEDADNNTTPVKPLKLPGMTAKAYFSVPLRRPDGSAFGVLSIQSAVPRIFPKPLKQAVRGLASLVAPSLNRLRKTQLQEGILREIGKGEPKKVMQESLLSIWETVNADMVIFYPYDPKRKSFRLDKIQKSPKSSVVPICPEDDTKTLNRLLQLGEYFSPDARGDEIFRNHWASRFETSSIASIALESSGAGNYCGVVVLHYTESRRFGNELRHDISLSSQFVAMAAHLMQQQEQHEAEERRQEIIQKLVGISDSAQLTQILEEALRQNWPGTPVLCRFLLAERGKRILYSPLAISNEPTIPFDSDHVAGQVAHNREYRLLEDKSDYPNLKVSLPTSRSALYVPVKLGDSVVGVLGIESPEVRVFHELDRVFLEEIADSAATALGAAGQADHARAVIAAAARAAASSPEQELKVLTKSAHEVASIAEGKPTSTTVFINNGQSLDLVSAWPPELFGELQKKVGTLESNRPPGVPRGIVALAAEKKESILIDKLPHDDYISFDARTRAELAVPVLAADGSVVGVLNIEYEEPNALNNEHKTLLERLADQAAIVAILQNQGEQKQKQRAAIAILGVEVGAIAHEWINNTATIRDNVEVMRMISSRIAAETLESKHPLLARHNYARLEELLNKLDSVASRIESVLTDAAKPLQAKEHIHDKVLIPVDRWLRKVQLTWSRLYSSVEFPLDVRTAPQDCIYANEYWLTRAINNLLHNGVRAAQGHTQHPRIWIRSYVHEHYIRVEICDNGPGIPISKQALLFSTLVPHGIHDIQGHGTGCLFTSFIAQEYSGQALALDSNEGGRVVLELPLTHATSDWLNMPGNDNGQGKADHTAGRQ